MDPIVLEEIQLQLYTDEEVRKIAVVQVKNPATYDRGFPKANGVNDARMGVTDKALQCPTCGLTSTCNNHYGYIELEREIIRFGHIASVLCLLRSVCWACSKPKFTITDQENLVDVKIIISKTLSGTKDRLRGISEACKNKFKCAWPDCGAPQPVYSRVNKVFFGRTFRPKEFNLFANEEERDYLKSRLMPDEIKSIIKHISHEALSILGFKPDISHPINYIMKAHLVPPPSIRPANAVTSTEARLRGENDLTVALQEVVRANNELASSIESKDSEKILNSWDKLQIFSAAVINQNAKKLLTFDGVPVIHARALGKRKAKVIKDRLTGKKGRLRGNLSGKRVDHAGRSVVGPDSTHDIFELGVPSTIMRTLTFPQNVTSFNKHLLEKCILNGSNTKNGALTVRIPDTHGEKILHISLLDLKGRIKLASSIQEGWTVERHLQDGDWVLFNRQPSLHKASIMAFKAYETNSAQFKLPLPCTKPFNADFDGDEMNLHALQDYCAISEAQEIMSVPHQMVTPQSNSVIIALVQDSIVGAYQISRKDAFCSKEEAIQLAMNIRYATKADDYNDIPNNHSLNYLDSIESFPSPCILKGFKHGKVLGPMWTGKQIFSWILPSNLNLSKCKNANPNSFQDIMEEKVVIVRKGEIMCGRLCKDTVGQSSGGIVQSIWKQYGPWPASKFVSDAQRLLMHWLRKDTVCISIRDCLAPCEKIVDSITSEAMGKVDEIFLADIPKEVKDVKQSQVLQETLRTAGAAVLEKMDSNSGIATVVSSGSKGNMMNIAQIAGLVGQQTINGSRIAFRKGPLGLRTLANFAPNDSSPEARGFVASSYVMGLQPYEFFFHQQAGREGVVATAVSTADTGYNQRRMVKNQESEVIGYDLSVRVSNNLIVQLHYGGDDYEGSMIERIKLNCLDCDTFEESFSFIKGDEKVWMKKAWEMLKAIKTESSLKYNIPFSNEISMPVNFYRIINAVKIGNLLDNKNLISVNDILLPLLENILIAHHGNIQKFIGKKTVENYLFWPERNKLLFDDPSLKSRLCLSLLCNSYAIQQNAITKNDAIEIISSFNRLYLKGIVNPGEGVGAVGSSSIGEPSTQMTLNIFHYSGIAEKNVTLTGLPRFKQIINAVDTYENANMTITLNSFATGKDLDSQKYNARKFASRQVKTLLSHIVSTSQVRLFNTILNTDSEDLKFALILNEISFETCKSTKIIKKKITDKKISAILAKKTTCGKRFSNYVAVYEIDKYNAYSKYLTIEEIGRGLENFLGSDAIVTWNEQWCDKWYIILRPPTWGEEHLDLSVTEAIHDSLLENASVNGMDALKKAVLSKSKDVFKIETEGSDLLAVAKLMEVDNLNTTTNNIQEVGRILGVEAGLCVMQAELHKVLSFDGSYVDPRHTWLLSDTVGRSGCINPLNRHKMEELGGSLLQCASFEQTLEVFENGAAFGKSDYLGGATEKLIVGQPVHVGTGSFGIINCEDSTRQPCAIIVPPLNLQDDENMSEVKVIPLKNEGIKPPDNLPDKIFDDPNVIMLSNLFNTMRQHAQNRIPVWVKMYSYSKIQKENFKRLENFLHTYTGWTNFSKNFEQITEVEYHIQNTLIVTSIQYKDNEIQTSHCINEAVEHLNIVVDNFSFNAEANTKKQLDGSQIPVSVTPLLVRIINKKEFVKGFWSIKIVKSWEGINNLEAENNQQHKNPDLNVEIELFKPWELMEIRGSSDLAMAGAMLERAYYLLYGMNK